MNLWKIINTFLFSLISIKNIPWHLTKIVLLTSVLTSTWELWQTKYFVSGYYIMIYQVYANCMLLCDFNQWCDLQTLYILGAISMFIQDVATYEYREHDKLSSDTSNLSIDQYNLAVGGASDSASQSADSDQQDTPPEVVLRRPSRKEREDFSEFPHVIHWIFNQCEKLARNTHL